MKGAVDISETNISLYFLLRKQHGQIFQRYFFQLFPESFTFTLFLVKMFHELLMA